MQDCGRGDGGGGGGAGLRELVRKDDAIRGYKATQDDYNTGCEYKRFGTIRDMSHTS